MMVSIPNRDFSTFQPSAVPFRSLASISKLPSVSIPNRDFSTFQRFKLLCKNFKIWFQSLIGILVHFNSSLSLIRCQGMKVSIPNRDFSTFQPKMLFK